jgi:predicted ester cyclase
MIKYPVYLAFVLFLFASCTSNGNVNESQSGMANHDDMQRWLDAWNSHSMDSIKSLYADSVMIYQPENPEPLTFKTMVPFFAMVFKAYPDIHFETEGFTIEGNEGASWENVTGTMSGPFTLPSTGVTIQPTGNKFQYKAAKRLWFNKDHRIIKEEIILDQLASGGSGITHADVQRWLDAWNSHKIDTIKLLFADSALIYQPQNPKPLTVNNMAPFFTMIFKTYPDIHFGKEGFTVDGYEAASWENVTGTMLGSFTNPSTGMTVAPTGKKFQHKGAMHLWYNKDHRITKVEIIWDQLIVLHQLGLPCE